jgi:hypothetical protein
MLLHFLADVWELLNVEEVCPDHVNQHFEGFLVVCLLLIFLNQPCQICGERVEISQEMNDGMHQLTQLCLSQICLTRGICKRNFLLLCGHDASLLARWLDLRCFVQIVDVIELSDLVVMHLQDPVHALQLSLAELVSLLLPQNIGDDLLRFLGKLNVNPVSYLVEGLHRILGEERESRVVRSELLQFRGESFLLSLDVLYVGIFEGGGLLKNPVLHLVLQVVLLVVDELGAQFLQLTGLLCNDHLGVVVLVDVIVRAHFDLLVLEQHQICLFLVLLVLLPHFSESNQLLLGS